jgi:hypothetical protein
MPCDGDNKYQSLFSLKTSQVSTVPYTLDEPYLTSLLAEHYLMAKYKHCMIAPAQIILSESATAAVKNGLRIQPPGSAQPPPPVYLLAHSAVPYGSRQDARLEPKYKQPVKCPVGEALRPQAQRGFL